jgi:hypothetical protein
MTYTVVLDERNSYLIPSDTGLAFEDACDSVIDYGIDANPQLAYDWMGIKEAGEASYKS